MCEWRSTSVRAGHRTGRGADAARARAHGRRQRAGIPPPGPALRGRARVLGDGLLRGIEHRNERRSATSASPRTSIRSRSRSSAPTRRDGRGGAHGRGRGRRHRRHQLRLPGAEGDEDRRRRDAARRPRARLPHRRRGRARGRPAGLREDAPRAAGRLARLPRRRAAAGRGGCVVAHAPSPLGAADVHGHRRPRADRRARLARRRARDRLRRHHLPRARPDSARDHRCGGGDGRTRRAGQPVGAARDGGRRRARSRLARRSSRSSSSSSARRCASSASGARAAS